MLSDLGVAEMLGLAANGTCVTSTLSLKIGFLPTALDTVKTAAIHGFSIQFDSIFQRFKSPFVHCHIYQHH